MRADARRRLDDLLLARAIDGLSAVELRELEELLSAHRDVDADAYDRTAAAICLAALGAPRAMPGSLRASIEQRALELAAKRPRSQR